MFVLSAASVPPPHTIAGDCFVCGVCAKPLGNSPFVVKGGLPHHKACHATASVAKCDKCTAPIVGAFVTADGAKYHK